MEDTKSLEELQSGYCEGCGCFNEIGKQSCQDKLEMKGHNTTLESMTSWWTRMAGWGLLLILFGTIRSTDQATVSVVSTTTPSSGCVPIFIANSTTDVFTKACVDVHFPCKNTSALQTTNRHSCLTYFTCANTMVWECPCSAGTKYDTSKGACDHAFTANCTCPNGRSLMTDSPPNGQGPEVRVNNTGLIAGLVVGVLMIIILVIIIVLLVRRKQQQQAKPMTPIGPQQSIKSTGYEDINDFGREYDNGPTFETAIYDNHGFADREAIRPRPENATIRSSTSNTDITPPPLPDGHPASTTISRNPEEEEPEYMETVE